MRMRFDEDARREYLDAIVFYSNSAQKVGVKFADAVESAIAKIGSSPTRFRELEAGIRRSLVSPIPYSILYHVSVSKMLILADKHTRRNPTLSRTRHAHTA